MVKEFSRSSPFQAHSSRYKLPALQILMLQEYPADCPQARSDLKSPHSESNVQYNVAVDLWYDQSSGKIPDLNLLFGVTSCKTMDTVNIHEIVTCQDLFTGFFCLLAHHIDTQYFRWRDKDEMLKVWSRKLKSQSISGYELDSVPFWMCYQITAEAAPKTG